mmetsp:Transcript_15573/g.33013  ORF Transcript_15573/g.33013 Transcript_15573/m.33013 type:complete len:206 (-) Transcript_15573:109-726(-)
MRTPCLFCRRRRRLWTPASSVAVLARWRSLAAQRVCTAAPAASMHWPLPQAAAAHGPWQRSRRRRRGGRRCRCPGYKPTTSRTRRTTPILGPDISPRRPQRRRRLLLPRQPLAYTAPPSASRSRSTRRTCSCWRLPTLSPFQCSGHLRHGPSRPFSRSRWIGFWGCLLQAVSVPLWALYDHRKLASKSLVVGCSCRLLASGFGPC